MPGTPFSRRGFIGGAVIGGSGALAADPLHELAAFPAGRIRAAVGLHSF